MTKDLGGGRGWLADDAADSILGTVDPAAQRELGRSLQITSAGRSYAEQLELWNAYQAGTGSLAAYPGTSPHESGRAIDTEDANWLRSHPEFGWSNTAVSLAAGETWHFEYRAGAAAGSSSGSSWSLNDVLSVDEVTRLQQQLGVNADGQAGPVTTAAFQTRIGADPDGILGPDSTRKAQAFVGADPDGIVGPDTIAKLKAAIAAGRFGTAAATSSTTSRSGGIINERLSVDEVKQLQTQLGVDPDGDAGPITTEALQIKVGVAPDRSFGPVSIRALQGLVGARQDGDWGDETDAKVREALAAEIFAGAGIPSAPPRPQPASYGWAPFTAEIVDLGFGDDTRIDIHGIALHHTTSTSGFSYVANQNDRDSHPTYHLSVDGTLRGVVAPSRRPYSTGPEVDRRSITIEMDNSALGGDWPISDAELARLGELIAWEANEQGFATIAKRDPAVDQANAFWVDWHQRTGSTACPGPFVIARLDQIVADAQARLDVLRDPATPDAEPAVELETPPLATTPETPAEGGTTTVEPDVGQATDAPAEDTSVPQPDPTPITPEEAPVVPPITSAEADTLKTGVAGALDTIPDVELTGAELGAVVTDTAKRATIYSWTMLIGIGLKMIGAGVGAAVTSGFAIWAALTLGIAEQAQTALAPWLPLIVVLVAVFAFVTGAYAVWAQQVVALARANTSSK